METQGLKIISLVAAALISCSFGALAEEVGQLDEAKLATIEEQLAKHGLYTQLFNHEIPKFDGVDNLDAYLAKVIERNMEHARTIRATLSYLESNQHVNSVKTDAALVKCLSHYFDKKVAEERQEVLAEVRFVLEALGRRSAISMIERKRDGLFFYADAFVQEVFLRELSASKKEADQQAIKDFMKLPKGDIKVADELLVELGLMEELPKESSKGSNNPLLPAGIEEK